MVAISMRSTLSPGAPASCWSCRLTILWRPRLRLRQDNASNNPAFLDAKNQNTLRSPTVLLFRTPKMAGLAIPGDAILQSTHAVEAEAPATVESLARQHGGLVFRIAYSILRNHHDAEDAAQECFLRVLKYGREVTHVRNAQTSPARGARTGAPDPPSAGAPSAPGTSGGGEGDGAVP